MTILQRLYADLQRILPQHGSKLYLYDYEDESYELVAYAPTTNLTEDWIKYLFFIDCHANYWVHRIAHNPNFTFGSKENEYLIEIHQITILSFYRFVTLFPALINDKTYRGRKIKLLGMIEKFLA